MSDQREDEMACQHEWSGALDKHPTCVKCSVAYDPPRCGSCGVPEGEYHEIECLEVGRTFDRVRGDPCVFVPPNEPFMCDVHPGGYRLGLDDARCRAAEAEAVEAMDAEQIVSFDRWAESRRGKGVSLGMLWALRLRATLARRPEEGLDVGRLALALASGDVDELDIKDEWYMTPRELADTIARQYARLSARCSVCDAPESDLYHGAEPCALCPHASPHHPFAPEP